MLSALKAFARNKMGNFAMATVFAFPAIFAGVATAVDITNTLKTKSELQNANDTAVLFAARFFKEYRRVPSNSQVQKFLDANASFPITNIKLKFDPERIEFTLTSDAKVNTMLMHYFAPGKQKYGVLSKASLGFSETLEFALALDTTGSMAGSGKMDALKVAANGFLDTMFEAKDKGADVKGAIVPFAQYVNVGLSQRRQSWLSVPRDIDTRVTTYECSMVSPVVGTTNCRNVCWPAETINHPASPGSCSTSDGVQTCSPGYPAWTENRAAGCANQCDNVYGPPEKVCQNVTRGELITWQGCVGSRAYPLNVKDSTYTTRIPGLLSVACSAEMQPLTDNRTVLKAKVDSLTPSGETYIPEGVMWGTRLLTPAAPFREGATRGRGNRPVRKVLILMTDGVNTLSPSFPLHDQANRAQADAYAAEACAEAKAQKLEVFTISFGAGVDADVKNLLESCASYPEQYFHADNAAGLTEAFKDIADALINVRLTQ